MEGVKIILVPIGSVQLGVSGHFGTENIWKVGIIQKIFINFNDFSCVIFWSTMSSYTPIVYYS